MSTKSVNTTLGFKKNGATHVALLIARSLRRRFTVADLQEISSTKFNNSKRTSQSLCLLVKHGFLHKDEQGWIITQEGINHLYCTAPRNIFAEAGH